MRLTFVLLLSTLVPFHAAAQCCCAKHDVVIRTPQPAHTGSQWHYTAELRGERVDDHSHLDSVPGDPYRVVLRQHTGCGIVHALWTLRHTDNRAEMRVNLYDMPGDVHLPAIVLPFMPGTTTYFNMHEVLACVSGFGGRWTAHSVDSVRCSNNGLAWYTYDAHGRDRFELLDIGAWMVPPGNAAPDGAPMRNELMSILPEKPVAGQAIHARFTWMDGSCGRYQHTAEVMHKPEGAEVTEILVSLGQEGPNCDDLKMIHRAVELPLLPPGKYRIRIGPPPTGTISVLPVGRWGEFEVLP